MRAITSVSFTIALLLFLGSCGGSSSLSLNGKYEVQDVNLLADDIDVGEDVRVEVFFETKTEFDGNPDGVEVVVRLPVQLQYLTGSSEIYDGTTRETDGRTPDNVISCPDGSSFIVYQFSDSDLEDRGLGSRSDYGFRFNVVGVSKVAAAFVRASAGESVEYSCGEPFSFEEEEAVEVL